MVKRRERSCARPKPMTAATTRREARERRRRANTLPVTRTNVKVATPKGIRPLARTPT